MPRSWKYNDLGQFLPNNLEEFLAPFGSHSSQELKMGPNQLRNNQSDEGCKVEADLIKTGGKIL